MVRMRTRTHRARCKQLRAIGWRPSSRYGNRTPLFESGTFNHSDTSPRRKLLAASDA